MDKKPGFNCSIENAASYVERSGDTLLLLNAYFCQDNKAGNQLKYADATEDECPLDENDENMSSPSLEGKHVLCLFRNIQLLDARPHQVNVKSSSVGRNEQLQNNIEDYSLTSNERNTTYSMEPPVIKYLYLLQGRAQKKQPS